MKFSISSQSSLSYEAIKLGIDANAKYYWVSRQIDGATPQPVQNMTDDELMLLVVKQRTPAVKVVCYEKYFKQRLYNYQRLDAA